jgi:protein SCO1/2
MRTAALVLATALPLLSMSMQCWPQSPPASLIDQLPATWVDDSGQPLQLPDLRGRTLIISMAYASCHRVCPVTMQRLAEIQQELDSRGAAAEFVVVSYDPTRDDAASWHRYRTSHRLTRDNWHFLIGTRGDVQRFAAILGFGFWHYDEHVVHDFRIVALNTDGALKGFVDSTNGDWRSLL